MKAEGEKIQGSQQGREVLLAMAEVMSQVVALGLKGIVILVLHLPSGAPVTNDVSHVIRCYIVICGECIFVDELAVGIDRRFRI